MTKILLQDYYRHLYYSGNTIKGIIKKLDTLKPDISGKCFN